MTGAKWVVGVILGWAALLTAGAHAQDWSQWLGANRDGRATGFKAPKAWPKELTKKWSVKVGDGVASPALVGDRLYVFSRQDGKEVTRCVKAADGEEVWKDEYATGGATGPASGFAGPRSSPVVAEGKVITLGVRGVLSCLDAGTGKKQWRKDDYKGSWPRFFTSSSPVVTGGLCIAQLGGEKNGAVVAYDLKTGEQKWKWEGDGTTYASLSMVNVGKDTFVIAETTANVVALKGGKLAWKSPFPIPGQRNYNASTPLADGATLIYGGSNRPTRAVKFERKGDELAATELWSNEDNPVLYNTPVLRDGLLYGISSRDRLFCINTKDGKTAWTAPLKTGGRRTTGYGSVVNAGPVLFALNPSANLLVFEPSATAFKQVASYKVSNEQTFAYPVIAGNRIFVKDSDSLTLWLIE